MSEEPQPNPGLETGETGTDVSTQALTQALRSGFVILYVVIIILLGYFLASNFFRVEPGQRAVVLRFGKPLQTRTDDVLKEGKLHFAWPYPVDEKVVVSGGESSVESTVGWHGSSASSEDNVQFNAGRDGYVLTRDWNILHVKVRMTYEVEDPIRYNFEFADVNAVLRSLLDNALTVTASQFEARNILERLPQDVPVTSESGQPATAKRLFQGALISRVRQLVRRYDLGLTVKTVTLTADDNGNPRLPRGQVTTLANNLQQSRKSAEDQIRNAEKERDRQITVAKDEARSIARSADVDSEQLATQLGNELRDLESLWKAHEGNPETLRLELRKRLQDQVTKILSDPNVEVTRLPAGPGGSRPRVKLMVRRLPPPPPEAMDLSGGGKKK
ncbi:MAG: hypothetical protein CMO66_01560 [Verrucomicrobiales bacterium]|nr:hypothetical protein [Verrucomicrobiales bacterium]